MWCATRTIRHFVSPAHRCRSGEVSGVGKGPGGARRVRGLGRARALASGRTWDVSGVSQRSQRAHRIHLRRGWAGDLAMLLTIGEATPRPTRAPIELRLLRQLLLVIT